MKDEDLFFLTDPTGDVPLDNEQGFGLYYHDCRFLQGYEFRIARARPNALAATSGQGSTSQFILTNPDLRQLNGTKLAKQSVGITWHRTIQALDLTVRDVIAVTNYVADSIQVGLSFDFQASFADILKYVDSIRKKPVGTKSLPGSAPLCASRTMAPMEFIVRYGLPCDPLP